MRGIDRRRLLIVGFLAFVGLGVAHSLSGAGWPSMSDDLDRRVEHLGHLVTVSVVGFGLTAAVSGSIARAIGVGASLVVSQVLMAIGLLAHAVGPTWGWLLAGSLLLGVGSGLLDPGVNAHVAANHGTRSMSLLHASFGIGSVVGPLVMFVATDGLGTWRWAFGAAAAVSVVMGVLFVATSPQWAVTTPDRRPLVRGAVPVRLVTPTLVAFALTVGIELAIGTWALTVLVERGVSGGVASLFLASYWGGITGGRLIGAVVGDTLTRRTMLGGSLVLLLSGLVVLGVDPGGWGAAGLPIAGLGVALLFPILVSNTDTIFRDAADVVIGWGLAGGSVGAATIPWAVGEIGARRGLDVIFPLLAAATVLLVAATLPVVRNRAETAPYTPTDV